MHLGPKDPVFLGPKPLVYWKDYIYTFLYGKSFYLNVQENNRGYTHLLAAG